MLAHVKAVQALLTATGYGTAHLVFVAEKPTYPYWVLEPQFASAHVEMPVCGLTDDLDLTFRVKSVALSSDSALTVAGFAQTAIAPMGHQRRIAVPGRSVRVWHERREADYVETQVMNPDLDRPVAISVDTYRLVSTPA